MPPNPLPSIAAFSFFSPSSPRSFRGCRPRGRRLASARRLVGGGVAREAAAASFSLTASACVQGWESHHDLSAVPPPPSRPLPGSTSQSLSLSPGAGTPRPRLLRAPTTPLSHLFSISKPPFPPPRLPPPLLLLHLMFSSLIVGAFSLRCVLSAHSQGRPQAAQVIASWREGRRRRRRRRPDSHQSAGAASLDSRSRSAHCFKRTFSVVCVAVASKYTLHSSQANPSSSVAMETQRM